MKIILHNKIILNGFKVVIVTQNKIGPFKVCWIFANHTVLDAKFRKRERYPFRLVRGEFDVVFVDVAVTKHDLNFPWFQICAVCHHNQEKAV